MNVIEPVDFLEPIEKLKIERQSASSDGFAAWLDRELSTVNTKIINSDVQLRKLAAGEVDNLHHVMISMEEAKLSFQLALQVRNRLMEAYQDVLRMQI